MVTEDEADPPDEPEPSPLPGTIVVLAGRATRVPQAVVMSGMAVNHGLSERAVELGSGLLSWTVGTARHCMACKGSEIHASQFHHLHLGSVVPHSCPRPQPKSPGWQQSCRSAGRCVGERRRPLKAVAPVRIRSGLQARTSTTRPLNSRNEGQRPCRVSGRVRLWASICVQRVSTFRSVSACLSAASTCRRTSGPIRKFGRVRVPPAPRSP